jgi:hypothetical protein
MHFDSVDAAGQYWLNKFGQGVTGDTNVSDFVIDLHSEGYNSKNPNYSKELQGQIDSVRHYEDMWKKTK